MKRIVSYVFVMIFLAACGPSTKISKSWRDPGYTLVDNQFNKVLVAAFMKDETSRRQVEHTIVQRMKNVNAVESYTLIGQALPQGDNKAIEDKLKGLGFDGAVVIRFLNMDKETNYVPGTTSFPPYYGGFGGYYWNAYGAYSTPGYYEEDKVYSIETNVYSIKESKLVWSGVTETTNPKNLESMTNEIADVVADRMRKEGFIPSDKK